MDSHNDAGDPQAGVLESDDELRILSGETRNHPGQGGPEEEVEGRRGDGSCSGGTRHS